jgi:twitching motility protein PilT
MYMNPAIENLIRENKTFRIQSTIQTSRKEGMMLLDDHLFELFTTRKINYNDMMSKSQNPEDIKARVREWTDQQNKLKAKQPGQGARA